MKQDKDFKKKESERVKAYRKRKTKQGFKNISFVVNNEEYKEIEKAKNELGLTTKELVFYYLRRQFLMGGRGYSSPYCQDYHDEIEFDPNFDLPMPEFLIDQFEKDQKRGESFELKTSRREKNYLTYVIVEFLYKTPKPRENLSYFPFRMHCVNKGYETYEEAMIAYLTKKPKLRKNCQHTLLRRKRAQTPQMQELLKNWYTPVFHLKEFYPNHPLGLWLDDERIDYYSAFKQIQDDLKAKEIL